MKNILIIDDDIELTAAVANLLETQGYAVQTAVNGTDGYAKAKETAPGLILLDVMMADKTEGFHLARTMKDDPATRDIPVVIMTGIRSEMNLNFRFEPDENWLPVRAVLEKPVKPDVLIRTVNMHYKA